MKPFKPANQAAPELAQNLSFYSDDLERSYIEQTSSQREQACVLIKILSLTLVATQPSRFFLLALLNSRDVISPSTRQSNSINIAINLLNVLLICYWSENVYQLLPAAVLMLNISAPYCGLGLPFTYVLVQQTAMTLFFLDAAARFRYTNDRFISSNSTLQPPSTSINSPYISTTTPNDGRLILTSQLALIFLGFLPSVVACYSKQLQARKEFMKQCTVIKKSRRRDITVLGSLYTDTTLVDVVPLLLGSLFLFSFFIVTTSQFYHISVQ